MRDDHQISGTVYGGRLSMRLPQMRRELQVYLQRADHGRRAGRVGVNREQITKGRMSNAALVGEQD